MTIVELSVCLSSTLMKHGTIFKSQVTHFYIPINQFFMFNRVDPYSRKTFRWRPRHPSCMKEASEFTLQRHKMGRGHRLMIIAAGKMNFSRIFLSFNNGTCYKIKLFMQVVLQVSSRNLLKSARWDGGTRMITWVVPCTEKDLPHGSQSYLIILTTKVLGSS